MSTPLQPGSSQLPYASIVTDTDAKNPALAPRLALDDVLLEPAIDAVLAQITPADAAAPLHPELRNTLDFAAADSWLLLVDLARGQTRLGQSLLAQTLAQPDAAQREPVPQPDTETAQALQAALRPLLADTQLLAGGSRGAGGLLACLVAMMPADGGDLALNIDPLLIDGAGDGRMDSGEAKNWTSQVSGLRHELTLRALFNEESGAVLQVATAQRSALMTQLRQHGLGRYSHFIAHLHGKGSAAAEPNQASAARFSIWRDAQQIFARPMATLCSTPSQ